MFGGFVEVSIALTNLETLVLLIEAPLLRFRKQSPIRGLGRTFIMMEFSFNTNSVTSHVRQKLPIGVSSCPLATIIWKFSCGPAR